MMDFFQMNLLHHSCPENHDNEIAISEEALEYQPKLTLYQMSSITLVVALWRQKRIQRELLPALNDFRTMRTATNSPVWRKIVKNVASDIQALKIPKSICYRLLQINGHIAKTLLQWLVVTNEVFCRNNVSTNNSIIYMNYIVWTQNGQIDEVETARSLLKLNSLSDDDKFLLACNNCLETEIYEFRQIVYPLYLKEKDLKFKKWPMVHYWISIITSDATDLIYRRNRFNRTRNVHYDIEKFSFVTCTSDGYLRLAAIKYLWNRLKIQDKILFANICISATNSVELAYYFLSQLDSQHRRRVLGVNYLTILKNLMVHWLWQDYFINVINLFWNMITLDEFLSLCKNAVNEMKCQSQDVYKSNVFRKIYHNLWQNMPKRIERAIFRDAHSIASVLKVVPWELDLVTVRDIISKIDEPMKKQVITSELGKKTCLHFINQQQWEFYDLYTTSMLLSISSKQDLFKFQQSLIQENGMSLAIDLIRNRGWEHEKEFFQWFFSKMKNTKFLVRYFINHGHWDLLDIYVDLTFTDKHQFYSVKSALIKEEGLYFAEDLIKNRSWEYEKDFMKWFFQNECKANEANKKLLHQYLTDKLCFSLSLYPNNYNAMNYFLNWSIEPSRDLYTTLLDEEYIIVLRQTIVNFVQDLKLMQADNVLNWYFGGDKERVTQFKNTFIMNTPHDWISFSNSLLKRDPEMGLLKNFVRWCFPDGDVRHFKDLLLKSYIWRRLLQDLEFELADDFVNWCVDSCIEKVAEFKNNKFVAFEVNLVMGQYLNEDSDEVNLKKILTWFNPNPTTIEVFKSTFTSEKHSRIRQLLDEMHGS